MVIFPIKNLSKIRHVVCFLLGHSPASDLYMPTFRNTLSVPSAFEDGTDRVFRNVGIYKSDAGESPKRKQTTYILLMNKELCIKVGTWNNSIIKCGIFPNKDVSNDMHSSCFQREIQLCVWLQYQRPNYVQICNSPLNLSFSSTFREELGLQLRIIEHLIITP